MARPKATTASLPGNFPSSTGFPAYRIVSTEQLLNYANNPRTHTDEQVSRLAASIQEFGFTNPVLVGPDNVIVAGHGRVLAARRLGMEQVPVLELANLSAVQRRAYVIADNRLALDAGWDDALLRLELGALDEAGFDLGLLGFTGDEIMEALGSSVDGLTDPDDAPALPALAVSRPGDVWCLGKHVLVCGDATNADDVRACLGDARPHLMVTDPPYGVDYDADWRNRAVMVKGERPGAHGSRAIGRVLNDEVADWRAAWALFPGTVAYVWHAGTQAAVVAASLEALRFKIRAQIVWVKQRFVIGRGDYHHQHEPAWVALRDGGEASCYEPEHEIGSYAVKDGAPGQYRGGRKQSTVWFVEHARSETGHSTQKPCEVMQRPMENNSQLGDAVFDPFMGSGTSLIAGSICGRVVYGLELSPAYVDVSVTRWMNFLGKEATLRATGQTFAAVAASRLEVAA